MLRQILFGIVLIASVFAGHAQMVSEYKFTVLNRTVGLAGNSVQGVIQDHQGFMWLATDGGLQRYDGKRFLTFKNRPGNLQTIPYNVVETVYEDSRHNLWIVTADDRIGIFNKSYFTYREIPIPNHEKKQIEGIKTLLEDANGNLYLTIHQQQKPFFRFSEKEQAFVPDPLNNVLPPNWGFNDLFFDIYSRRFWIATDSGLVVHDAAKKQTSYRDHNAGNDPVISKLGRERYTTMPYVDHQKNFWCVIAGIPWEPPVIHRFEPATLHLESHRPWTEIRTNYRQVKNIFSQRNGRIWIAGYPFLMEYKKNGRPVFDSIPVNDKCNPKSLTFNAAGHIFEDSENTLWICTTDGVIRFTPDANLFSNYLLQKDRNSPAEEQATLALFQRKNGEIWIGCGNAGLYTYSKDFAPVAVKGDPVKNFPAKTVWSIHEHSRTGLVWMGASKGQIAVYDPKTGKIDIWTPPLLDEKATHIITEDKKGNLWFITRTGDNTSRLVKWDRAMAGDDPKKGFVLVNKSTITYTSLLVDKQGALWVGTYGAGIEKYNTSTNALESKITPTRGDDRSVLYDHSIADLIQFDDTTIVAAGNVLSFINTRTNAVTSYTRLHGLPGTALSVEKDRDGILWMAILEGGLCRFNPSRKIFTLYQKEDGMYDDNFNAGASRMLSDGRLVFYTSRCLVAFDPQKAARIASAPAATITDFKLLNISLPVDSLTALSRLHLPYDKNSVTVEFSALSFASQNKVNYYYQMEGLDKDWIPADETQKAIYNYLPNGRYTFRIKTDNGSSGQTAVTSLAISVHAPFWKTWWFWGLIALVVAGVLYLLDRERVKRLVSMQKMRTEIALNLHNDISSTLNNINLLSEMARIKADKDLDRSKEYIQQISDKSNRMIVAMGDILWSIEPDNDSMERSLLRMREFIDELKSRYNARIELVADKHPGRISMDMKKRHEFFLIFKDALRSVVELAEGRDTLIHLDATKTKLLLKLQDATANPFTRQAALREAIKDIENRAALIDAETDIQYDQKGIAMIIQLPLTA